MTELPPLLPEDVAEIVAILDGTPYERLDIRTARLRLRVARAEGGWTQDWSHDDEDVPRAAVVPEAVPEDHGPTIRSPLPGAFYRAPKPGAPPFVEVGDRVEPDTVVGIIETMKVMNSVPAGITGTIAAIVAGDGQQVDAGAVLMRIDA